jgi:hypothetical protein
LLQAAKAFVQKAKSKVTKRKIKSVDKATPLFYKRLVVVFYGLIKDSLKLMIIVLPGFPARLPLYEIESMKFETDLRGCL